MSDISPADQVIQLNIEVEAAQAKAELLLLESDAIEAADDTDFESKRGLMNDKRNELDEAQAYLRSTTAQLETVMKAQLAEMEAAMRQQMEAVRKQIAPLQAKADAMGQAVEAISLYLGSEEHIVVLQEGEDAPASTPITVYQNILFMDEEMALSEETRRLANATIDPGNSGWKMFDDWLTANPNHLNQVCPAQKGIVALRSARKKRSAPGEELSRLGEDGSEITHFLIRNGENIVWIIASYDFAVGKRLIPSPSEFDHMFYDRHSTNEDGSRKKLEPGTWGWNDAVKQSDTSRKHFMKIALILQGVIDRTVFLHPLPAETVSFTEPQNYDRNEIILVTDEMALDDVAMPYPEWIETVRSEISPGQRIIIGQFTSNNGRYAMFADGGVVEPQYASNPPEGVTLVVRNNSVRGTECLFVSYPRTDKVYRKDVPVPDKPGYVYSGMALAPAKSNARVAVTRYNDWWIPIDHPLVTSETIRHYLLSRKARRHFRSMIPLLREVLSTVEAEENAEKPFRELLKKEAIQIGHSEETAADTVDELVFWWKTKKKEHQALVNLEQNDNKAWKQITAEMRKRHKVHSYINDPEIVAAISDDAIWVGRSVDRKYVTFRRENATTSYLCRKVYSKSGELEETKRWISKPDVRSMQTISGTEEFETLMPVNKNQELTEPELESLTSDLLKENPGCVQIVQHWESHTFEVRSAPEMPVESSNLLTERKADFQYKTKNYGIEREHYGIHFFASWNNAARNELTSSYDTSNNMSYEQLFHTPTPVINVSTGDEYPMRPQPTVLYENTSEYPKIVAILNAYDAIATKRSIMEKNSTSMTTSILAQYKDKILTEEYGRFVSKYGTEAKGRWETKLSSLESKLSPDRINHNSIRKFCDQVAETNSTALTIGEATEFHDTLPAVLLAAIKEFTLNRTS